MRHLIDDDSGVSIPHSGPPTHPDPHPRPRSHSPEAAQAISEKNQKAIKTLHNRNVQKLIFANASSQS